MNIVDFLNRMEKDQGFFLSFIAGITLIIFLTVICAAIFIGLLHFMMAYPLLAPFILLSPGLIITARQFYIMRKKKND